MTCDSPDLYTNHPYILVLKTTYNKTILIDKKWLSSCSRLQDAYVFKELFKLNDESPWGNYPMKKDSNGYITLFKDLDIDTKHWFSLQTFLKTGFTSFWHDNNKRDYYLEHTNIVANKLGGFPSFDKFYENYHEKKINGIINISEETYSPLRPNEDDKDEYLWRIINPVDGNWQDNEFIDSGWKITVLVNSSQINDNKYFSRKKIINQT